MTLDFESNLLIHSQSSTLINFIVGNIFIRVCIRLCLEPWFISVFISVPFAPLERETLGTYSQYLIKFEYWGHIYKRVTCPQAYSNWHMIKQFV